MRLLKRHGYDSRTGAPHTKQNAMLQPEGAMDAKRNRGILYEGAQLKGCGAMSGTWTKFF